MKNLKGLLLSIIRIAFSGYLFIYNSVVYGNEVSFSRLNSAEYIVQVRNNEQDPKVTFNLNQSFDKNWKLYLLSDKSCENLKEDRLEKFYTLTFPGKSKVPEYFHFSNIHGFNTWIIDKAALSDIDAVTVASIQKIPMNNFCFYLGYKYAYWMEIGKIMTLGGLFFFRSGSNYLLSTKSFDAMKKISSVVIATHFFSYGPGQALRDYFKKNKSVQLIYLEHNLFGNILTWAFHIFKNIYLTLTSFKKHDLYVGCNNLNALSGIILKKLGIVRYTIYYCVDFSPNRFSNYFLNKIYLLLDRYCVENSDSVWNCCAPTMGLDPMMLMRESIGLPRRYRKKQIAVQDGTEMICLPDEGQISEKKIGFVGHLKVENGLFTLIEAYRIVRTQVPDVRLLIIGSGPIEEQIRAALNGDDSVEMTGYMGDIKQVLNKLSYCSIGVAPYEVNNLTPYSDPGKVKAYMSAGLAIVMSSVPDISKFVVENECGVVCEPGDPTKLATALLEVIKNKDLQLKFRTSSKNIRESLTWDSTYNKVFDSLSIQLK